MSEAYHESRKMGTATAAEVAKSKFEPEWDDILHEARGGSNVFHVPSGRGPCTP